MLYSCMTTCRHVCEKKGQKKAREAQVYATLYAFFVVAFASMCILHSRSITIIWYGPPRLRMRCAT